MIAEAASETAQAIPTRDDSRRIRRRESSKNVTGQTRLELLFDGQRPGMQQRLLALPGNPIVSLTKIARSCGEASASISCRCRRITGCSDL